MKRNIRALRSIDEVLMYIKKIDSESAVTRYMICNLVKNDEVYHISSGVKTLVDLNEILEKLGLLYED